MRRRPYTVRVGDRYKVKYYKGEVLIALVLVLDIMPLAIIYAVIYIYSKWLKVRYFISSAIWILITFISFYLQNWVKLTA